MRVCVVTCPPQTLALATRLIQKGYHYSYAANPETCMAAQTARLFCPDGVITVYKVKIG